MKKIPQDLVHFFLNQGYTIVSTVDKEGVPHNSCKGIISINQEGIVYLLDLYLKETYRNLKNNPSISITAVDEHKFKGFSLKGKAKILNREDLSPQLLKAWEEKINSRITRRLIKNMKEEKGHPKHPEALMPEPAYLIEVEVKDIVDLTPHHLKEVI